MSQAGAAWLTLNKIYNGVGDRVGQTTSVTTTCFALDVMGPSTLLRTSLPEVIYTTEGNLYLHLPGVIMAENGSGEIWYLLSDGLGSVRQATDESGEVVAYNEFDPYGNPIRHSPFANSPYGFTGEWWEEDIGLLHLRARWYAPETGTFLSVDPVEGKILEPQTFNGWNYTNGNSVNYSDPSGKVFCRWGIDPETGQCKPAPPWATSIEESSPLGTILVRPALDAKTALFIILGVCGYYLIKPLRDNPPQDDSAPHQNPRPAISPVKIPPPPTPTPPRDTYVADSNIFLDRVEGGVAQRRRIDQNYLANSNVTLYVPAAAISEVYPTPSQMARLSGIPGGAKLYQYRMVI